MPKYEYRARIPSGKIEVAVVEAASQEAAVYALREQRKFCIQIKEVEDKKPQLKKLKLKDLTLFCRQLAAMLSTGINMTRALDTIILSNISKRTKAACKELKENVLDGRSLSDSMKLLGKTFPNLLIYMAETGESSGSLDTIMNDMAVYYQNELMIRKRVINAMIYPIILSVVAVVVVIFLLSYVMPTFISMYDGVDLPVPTQMLLHLSDFITTKWLYILIVITLGVGLFVWGRTQHDFRVATSQLALRLPIFGKLIRTMQTSRFASTFAILYASGISMLRSIDIVSSVMSNAYVQDQLKIVGERIQQGRMLSDALSGMTIFDPMLYTTIGVGEESGRLETMLRDSGVYFSEEASNAMNQMVSMLEPIMIVLLAVVVGFIVIAIMLPIFNMFDLIM